MNNLYSRLKPHHIQQNTKDGCSIASYVMVHNAILTARGETNRLLSQDILREYLPSISKANGWYTKTKGDGRGIAISDLKLSLNNTLIYFKLPYICEKVSIKRFTPDELLQYFVEVENSENRYIIMNWDSHYSPLGCSGKNLNAMLPDEVDEIRILNVDGLRKYRRRTDVNYNDIHFEYGVSETCLNLALLYKKLRQQNRSFLLIRPTKELLQ